MGRSKLADDLLLPWVNVFLSAPLSAMVPIIMVLAGIGEATIILTGVLFATWIVMLNARAGVMNISPSLVDMSRSFGASRWFYLKRKTTMSTSSIEFVVAPAPVVSVAVQGTAAWAIISASDFSLVFARTYL